MTWNHFYMHLNDLKFWHFKSIFCVQCCMAWITLAVLDYLTRMSDTFLCSKLLVPIGSWRKNSAWCLECKWHMHPKWLAQKQGTKYNQQNDSNQKSQIILFCPFPHLGGCKLIGATPCWNMSNLILPLCHTHPQKRIKSFVNIKLRPPSHNKDSPW